MLAPSNYLVAGAGFERDEGREEVDNVIGKD